MSHIANDLAVTIEITEKSVEEVRNLISGPRSNLVQWPGTYRRRRYALSYLPRSVVFDYHLFRIYFFRASLSIEGLIPPLPVTIYLAIATIVGLTYSP